MFISKFGITDSVLTPGFTDRDATPPDRFVSKKKVEAESVKVEAESKTNDISLDDMPDF